MSVSRSADELLFQIEAEKLGHDIPEPKAPEPEPEVKETHEPDKESEPESKPLDESITEPEVQKETKSSEDKPEDSITKAPTDEYGNELPTPRTYSEEEVQRMIRDRLARGKHQEPTPQQQIAQQAAQNFTPDPDSSENWEVQLERFVENTIQKVTQKQQTEQQQYKEQQIQAEFESKFTTGMNRYKDFVDVVGSKPITNAMMLASRGMADPAAFLYAAAKNHGVELERIAQMADPYQQGAAIGRLEATMKKARAVTAAAKPLAKTVGDIAGKGEIKQSMDDLIRKDAQRKFRR